MARVRIADVAERAGVSKGAVSFALNGRPGVSEETRERVLRIAKDMGWRPNMAARALAGGRTDTIGLILNRPPRVRGVEPLFQHFMEGAQDELVDQAISLMMQVVSGHEAELATYEQWQDGTRVDGLILLDLRSDDDRPALLQRLGLPAVTLGDPRFTAGLPTVWSDDAAAAARMVEHLVELGHRRIARVAAGARMAHSLLRTEAMAAAVRAAGLPQLVVVEPGGRAGASAEATRRLLAGDEPPTAIVYESDLMAMAGAGAADELGLQVPQDLSVLAWDSSGVGRLMRPALTCMVRDARAEGAGAVRMLLDLVGGRDVVDVQAPTARLQERDSTGPAPA